MAEGENKTEANFNPTRTKWRERERERQIADEGTQPEQIWYASIQVKENSVHGILWQRFSICLGVFFHIPSIINIHSCSFDHPTPT